MNDLLLPSKVEFQQGNSEKEGKLVVTPCYFGYGTTLGNGLRRVLLSSLPGTAVEAFKIKGVPHEFTAVEGVKEDVVQIILNLKQLAVKVFTDENVVLTIKKKGKGEVKAGDIEPNSNVEIVDKDFVIATLTSDKEFEMEIIVGRGRGFKPAEEKEEKKLDLGTIAIDSIYNPVKDVGYTVEYTRVGDITNYEKLTINIETNGTISAKEAFEQATRIITDHYNIISSALNGESIPDNSLAESEEEEGEEPAEESGEEDE